MPISLSVNPPANLQFPSQLLIEASHPHRPVTFRPSMFGFRFLTICLAFWSSSTTAMAPPTVPLPPKDGIDFEALPWNMNLPDEVSYIHLRTNGEWTAEHYDPKSDTGSLFEAVNKYSNPSGLGIRPACTSLNYGTTIWEGLKCMRLQDGTPVVFRPDRNYERFARGAEQMCLPKPSRELFMRGIQLILQENSHVIPPHGDGMKLYVRPMLFGSGQQLGLHPSPEFSLLFYVSPTVSIGSPW